MIARLPRELPPGAGAPAELIDKARVLDALYIPARYPNSHPEGAPFEHYGPLQSGEAIRYAGEILEFVRARMA
ncbi:MAG: HEPN domain-containing protein [Acidobacteria bacterium]|nr:HEPN domain-containing protein [Acidobacteriota bacterium]